MQWLLTLLSIIVYVAGLIMLIKITPELLKRAYDDLLFIPTAAGIILGAMFAFAGVGVTFAVFTGSTVVRAFDVVLLLGILIVALRTSTRSFRPRYDKSFGTHRTSRILAGSFYLLLIAIDIYILILLFTAI